MKNRYKLIFFGIGLFGIALLLWKADLKTIDWQSIFSLDSLALLGVLAALWIVIYIIHTICYKIILKEESWKINFFSMFTICASGFALNNVTPAGLVGGEPYRIMALKRYCSTEKATSSTLTFTLVYTFGHIMLWITAAILYCILGLPGSVWVTVLILTAGTLLIGLFVIFLVCRKNGFAYPTMKFLAKLPILRKKLPAYVEMKKDSYIEIDDNIREFRNTPARFAVVLLLQYLTRILEAVEYFLLFMFFIRKFNVPMETTASLLDGILIMGIASLIGNILFIIPMQAATREGGMTIALAFLMTGEAASFIGDVGVGIGLLYRIREFFFIVLGVIMVLISKRGKKEFTEEELEQHQQLKK